MKKTEFIGTPQEIVEYERLTDYTAMQKEDAARQDAETEKMANAERGHPYKIPVRDLKQMNKVTRKPWSVSELHQLRTALKDGLDAIIIQDCIFPERSVAAIRNAILRYGHNEYTGRKKKQHRQHNVSPDFKRRMSWIGKRGTELLQSMPRSQAYKRATDEYNDLHSRNII